MTAALILPPRTTTLAKGTCPANPCTALLVTVALRSRLWEGAAVVETRRGENLLPLYRVRPVRIKGTGRGHSRLLALVLKKWMVLNLGKRIC